MKRTKILFLILAFLFLLPLHAWAAPASCTISSSILYRVDGSVAANTNIQFKVPFTQTFGNDTVAPSTVLEKTDANGVFPAGVAFPQSLHMNVTVGIDTPLIVTMPNGGACPVTLGALLAANLGTLGPTLLADTNATGFGIYNLKAPNSSQVKWALSEGNPIGAITPAAGTFTTTTLPISITTNTVLSATDQFVRCDATAGAVTATLPVSVGKGERVQIAKVDATANACNVIAGAGDQIWGSALSLPITALFGSVMLVDYRLGFWSEVGVPPVITGPSGSYVTHYNTSQTVLPAVSSCGTGAAVTANSSDATGYVTVGSTNPTTSCTITFNLAYVSKPVCFCGINNGTQQMCNTNPSTTTEVMTFASDVHGQILQWECVGNAN